MLSLKAEQEKQTKDAIKKYSTLGTKLNPELSLVTELHNLLTLIHNKSLDRVHELPPHVDSH